MRPFRRGIYWLLLLTSALIACLPATPLDIRLITSLTAVVALGGLSLETGGIE